MSHVNPGVPRVRLPVESVLPSLIENLQRRGRAVLKAPTGAGKTSRVPPALHRAGLGNGRSILLVQPRRLAAVAAARRMAQEFDFELGRDVGYHIRFERKSAPDTPIVVVTEGILLRYLLADPFLEQAGLVIFDEFHERNLNCDLALAILRRIQLEFRPELRLLAMSATLDPAPLARFLDGDVVESEGRLFPVEIRYTPLLSKAPLPERVAASVRDVADQVTGHVLAFLPGVGEIQRTRAHLRNFAEERGWQLCDLHGSLPVEEQDTALRESGGRKIVLATNVAETSVTVEGVGAVIDSGLARTLRFDAGVGLNRLLLGRISRASADQRAGRAGRTGPGLCVRLWSESEQRALRDYEPPEVHRLDLSGAVLQLHCWGEADARRFPWFEPPQVAAVEHAEVLLERLRAVERGQVTARGRHLARFPVHPRLAAMLLAGAEFGAARGVALAAALLSERDPFRSPDHDTGQHPSSPSDSDILDRVRALERFEQAGQGRGDAGRLDRQAARFVLRSRDQLLRELRGKEPASGRENDEPFLRALLAGFPDRVARRRRPGSRQAVMVGGRGVRLANDSGVRSHDLFLCVDIAEVGRSEALVRQASRLDRSWLSPDLIEVRVDVEFDEQRERVVAYRRVYYLDLVLEEAATDSGDLAAISQRLCQEAGLRLSRALPLDDDAVQTFLARVRWLREWLPEQNLPAFDDDQLRGLLPAICSGHRSFAELKRVALVDWLRGELSPGQQTILDREAPERLTVPSGKRYRLQYEPGRPPILAVRIQEVFGWRETPRLAAGKVPVLLHLLAPNMRPQQITDDLGSFWKRGYAEVRKELRRRYPKHAWPENPGEGGDAGGDH